MNATVLDKADIGEGAITSYLCLGETFYWKYVLAGALATMGIYIINKGK